MCTHESTNYYSYYAGLFLMGQFSRLSAANDSLGKPLGIAEVGFIQDVCLSCCLTIRVKLQMYNTRKATQVNQER